MRIEGHVEHRTAPSREVIVDLADVDLDRLKPTTRDALVELAAVVASGFPATR